MKKLIVVIAVCLSLAFVVIINNITPAKEKWVQFKNIPDVSNILGMGFLSGSEYFYDEVKGVSDDSVAGICEFETLIVPGSTLKESLENDYKTSIKAIKYKYRVNYKMNYITILYITVYDKSMKVLIEEQNELVVPGLSPIMESMLQTFQERYKIIKQIPLPQQGMKV